MKPFSMLFVLAAVPAMAQPTTVKDFLAAADAQNVDHRISIEQRERAVAEFHQAWTALLPSVAVSGNFTYNQYAAQLPAGALGPDAIVITPNRQLDGVLRFDLALVDTTRWMRVLSASTNRQSAAERAEMTKDLVRRQVVASFYGYAAALAVLESGQRSLTVAVAQLKLAEVRAQAGSATELEPLRARAEVERNRQVVTDSLSLVATTRRTLRTLSGVEPPDQVALPQPDLRPEPSFEEMEQRVDGLPSVRAADHDVDAAGYMATASRLALVPVVSAQFTERATNAAGFTGRTFSYNAGFGLTWRLDGPTLAGMGVQSHIEQTARLGAEKARLAARDQIHSDWQRFNASLQKVGAAQAQVQAATRAAQVARDRYAVGAATQVDVIQAERDVFTAELGQIQAKTELATARASLRISAGRPLDEAP